MGGPKETDLERGGRKRPSRRFLFGKLTICTVEGRGTRSCCPLSGYGSQGGQYKLPKEIKQSSPLKKKRGEPRARRGKPMCLRWVVRYRFYRGGRATHQAEKDWGMKYHQGSNFVGQKESHGLKTGEEQVMRTWRGTEETPMIEGCAGLDSNVWGSKQEYPSVGKGGGYQDQGRVWVCRENASPKCSVRRAERGLPPGYKEGEVTQIERGTTEIGGLLIGL